MFKLTFISYNTDSYHIERFKILKNTTKRNPASLMEHGTFNCYTKYNLDYMTRHS